MPVKRGARWFAAVVLVALAAILTPVCLVARFAHGELLNTDRYVDTVAPLASDPAVQAAVTNRVTEEIISRIDVSELVTQLVSELTPLSGERAGELLSGPITDWLTTFIREHVQQFVSSPRFERLWIEVNRRAHRAVDAILTGETRGVVTTAGTAIVLNIGPIVEAVKADLASHGFGLAAKVPATDIQFTLAQSDALPKAQKYVRWLNTAATWLPWVVIALFVAAAWVAPSRRRLFIGGLVAAGVMVLFLLAAVRILRNEYLDRLSAKGLDTAAGSAVFDYAVRFLRQAAWVALAAALVGIVWAWLAGPSRPAVAIRRLVGQGTGALARLWGAPRTGVLAIVERARPWVYAVLGLAGLAILLHSPSGGTLAWLVVAAAAIVAAFAVVHRLRPPELAQ